MSNTGVTVFYHGDCQDGFAAAWCAWRCFGSAADYQPMHYGDRWPMSLVDGRRVFILDFSADRETVLEIARRADGLLLLDHHATPCKDWQDLLVPDAGSGLQRFDDPRLKLTVAFDMNRSGARLAWDWFFPEQALPRMIAHVEDQDLWRFAMPETRAYCRALRCRPFEFPVWEQIAIESGVRFDVDGTPGFQRMLIEGQAIEGFFAQEVRQLAAIAARPVRLRGDPIEPAAAAAAGLPVLLGATTYRAIEGLCANASPLFASELGELLARRSGSFGMTWMLRGDGRVKVSLRAEGAVNVANIAERYGGGGHPNAAGFLVAATDFFCAEHGIASAI